jgi:hypothetical protein
MENWYSINSVIYAETLISMIRDSWHLQISHYLPDHIRVPIPVTYQGKAWCYSRLRKIGGKVIPVAFIDKIYDTKFINFRFHQENYVVANFAEVVLANQNAQREKNVTSKYDWQVISYRAMLEKDQLPHPVEMAVLAKNGAVFTAENFKESILFWNNYCFTSLPRM